MTKIFFTTLFLVFTFHHLALADCKVQLEGAKINRPMPAKELKDCHGKIQRLISSNTNAFRYCREKYDNEGAELPLSLMVAQNGKIEVSHDCNRIIQSSKSIEQAQATQKASECFEERFKKLSLGDYNCSCAIAYQWDGSFPLITVDTQPNSRDGAVR